MQRKALILGATGGFGRAAVRAMADAGWEVSALARKGQPEDFAESSTPAMLANVRWIQGAVEDEVLLERAAQDADVIVHALNAWAYLPDAAIALERVARHRMVNSDLSVYMEIPFAGHHFSLQQLKSQLETLLGRKLKTATMPWRLLAALGVFVPIFRDLVSMCYLWDHDIRLDNALLVALLGDNLHHTPLDMALQATVKEL